MSNKVTGHSMIDDIFNAVGGAYDMLSGKVCVFCNNTGWIQEDDGTIRQCPKGCKNPNHPTPPKGLSR